MTKINKLLILRTKIDLLDSKLISIVSKRLKLVAEVGKIKKANDIKPLDNNRWIEVLKTRKLIGKSLGITPKFIGKLFEEIHTESLRIEGEIIK